MAVCTAPQVRDTLCDDVSDIASAPEVKITVVTADAPLGYRRDGTPRKPGPWCGAPGPGRPAGWIGPITRQVRSIARALLEDAEYRTLLAIRLKLGEAPHMETLLWHYAYGKPKEQIEVKQVEDFTDLTTDELRERSAFVAQAIQLLPKSDEQAA